MLKAMITAALLAATPCLAPTFANQAAASEASIFFPGVYQGQWKDGQILTDEFYVADDNSITMTRLGTGARSLFQRAAPNAYVNSHGSRVIILNEETLLWSNRNGGNQVIYYKR